ncbi:MAG: AAA family ATPase [Candidatus Marinimicrobia bacterium]|nr:AAA family ATPase [Candidatus Neomarinimicrobiota bacterium]
MDKGTHFYKCEFQVHSPRDINWSGNKPVTDVDRNAYADSFILACRQRGINAVAITDHHDFTFFPFIKKAAKNELDETGNRIPVEKRIIVFPGLELTFTNPASCQALLIIDASFPEDQLIRILNKLAINPNPINEQSTAEIIPIPSDVVNGLTDLHAKLDAIDILKYKYIVLPNLSQGHGSILRRGFYEHYKKMPCVSGYVDGAVPVNVGFINIVNGKDRNYGFKSVAVFQTSDNRKETFKDLGNHTTWVKWSEPTAEALRQASLAKESRLTNNEPELPQIYITKISVTNSKFMSGFVLELNQQYNSLIGGRGTGKSTVLEYIRWGLCDQILDTLDEEEQSAIQRRRRILIENTLVLFNGEVRVNFIVNGIEHIVKKHSVTKEIHLKIGSGEFTQVSDEEIARILPIQAYSQKQLSSVGVRTDELKRFIQQPIANELNDIRFKLRDIAKNIRSAYNNLVQKKELQSEVDQLQLQVKSLKEQVQNLRNSLKGISEDDQKIIAKKQLYENEQTFIQESRNELALFEGKINQLAISLKDYPSFVGEDMEFENRELISSIEEESKNKFDELKSLVNSVKLLFGEESLSTLIQLIEKWNKFKSRYDIQYKQAKEKASSNEHIIKEIENLELKIRELTNSINERLLKIKEIGNPESQFSSEREKWYEQHRSKISLLDEQAQHFTNLSQGIIKADVTRNINISQIREELLLSFTRTRISRDKIQKICDNIIESESPLETWESILEELRILAELKFSEDKTMKLPETKILTESGLNDVNRQRITEIFSSDNWLKMLTQEIDFEPTFDYSTNNEMGDVIPFSEASAGQQATALLSVLLNQDGTPLLIDQPEDDIDNKAIDEIIKSIWSAKRKRQLIFASHNANFVVNGDAELVVCFDYKESSQQTHGVINIEGAIDKKSVRDEITSVMEGGEKAFILRKDKYGF